MRSLDELLEELQSNKQQCQTFYQTDTQYQTQIASGTVWEVAYKQPLTLGMLCRYGTQNLYYLLFTQQPAYLPFTLLLPTGHPPVLFTISSRYCLTYPTLLVIVRAWVGKTFVLPLYLEAAYTIKGSWTATHTLASLDRWIVNCLLGFRNYNQTPDLGWMGGKVIP